MTPQSILEDMARFEARAGDRLGEFFEASMWKIARDTVSDAIHFEFAASSPKSEHIEFADDMMARGHFRQLQSGTVVPVAPSIVNADASVRPMAKQYRVQQQAQG